MGIKLYDALSSSVARSLATSDPAVNVRLDDAAPPAANTVFIADGAGAGAWGAPPGSELPEILQAIAIADPPDTAGQVPSYDGAGITWTAPSGGGGAAAISPALAAPMSPSAIDDEFASGPSDFAERGWLVYNETDGVAMTRVGDTVGVRGSLGLSNSQYRSTRVGSQMLVQVPGGKVVSFARTFTLNGDGAVYAVRCSSTRINSSYYGGQATEIGVWYGNQTTGPFTTRGNGNGIQMIGAAPAVYRWKTAGGSVFDQTAPAPPPVDLLVFAYPSSVAGGDCQGFWMSAANMQVYEFLNSHEAVYNDITTAGFTLKTSLSGVSDNPANATFAVDFFRKYPCDSWFNT